MPGDHGFKERSNVLSIAGITEEDPIDVAKALPDPEDMASHPTKEEVPIDDATALPDPNDYASHPTSETNPLSIAGIKEDHNPLDIPFGYEVDGDSTKEINMNVKDPELEEGGLGSGRNPEAPSEPSTGQPGPLISFGETIMKQFVDSKLSCPCSKKK